MGKLPEKMEYSEVVEEVVLSEVKPKMALWIVDTFDKDYTEATKIVGDFFKKYLKREV
jgi:hypothetical protein